MHSDQGGGVGRQVMGTQRGEPSEALAGKPSSRQRNGLGEGVSS